jgi:UDP-glucose 4-epimerase
VGPLADLIVHEPAYGQVVNLGGVEEISIANLAQRVIEMTDSKSTIRYVPYEEAYEEGFEDMLRRVPDVTRARGLIDFDPKHSLDDMLAGVIAEQRG